MFKKIHKSILKVEPPTFRYKRLRNANFLELNKFSFGKSDFYKWLELNVVQGRFATSFTRKLTY